jgi:hypothetical protein
MSFPLLPSSCAAGGFEFSGVAGGGTGGPLRVAPVPLSAPLSAPRLHAQLASLDAAASAFIRPSASTAAETSRSDRMRSGRTSSRRRADHDHEARGESDEAAALWPEAAVMVSGARDIDRPARSPPAATLPLPLPLPLPQPLGSAASSAARVHAHRTLRSAAGSGSQLPPQERPERKAAADFAIDICMPPLTATDPRRRQEQILLAAAAATSHAQ